ncbi:MAG: hypothetical protein K2X98_04420 [Alphaproteobacteria bacterium]|nr:hypothetical protein [Alphaproteobacteria bacterium]
MKKILQYFTFTTIFSIGISFASDYDKRIASMEFSLSSQRIGIIKVMKRLDSDSISNLPTHQSVKDQYTALSSPQPFNAYEMMVYAEKTNNGNIFSLLDPELYNPDAALLLTAVKDDALTLGIDDLWTPIKEAAHDNNHDTVLSEMDRLGLLKDLPAEELEERKISAPIKFQAAKKKKEEEDAVKNEAKRKLEEASSLKKAKKRLEKEAEKKKLEAKKTAPIKLTPKGGILFKLPPHKNSLSSTLEQFKKERLEKEEADRIIEETRVKAQKEEQEKRLKIANDLKISLAYKAIEALPSFQINGQKFQKGHDVNTVFGYLNLIEFQSKLPEKESDIKSAGLDKNIEAIAMKMSNAQRKEWNNTH